MYLSRLHLDPTNRQVRKEIANRYELHRTLTTQFGMKTRHEIGLLYRIEPKDNNLYEPIILLVQTKIEPDWNHLFKKGILTQPAEIKQFEPIFENGRLFHFRLMANPTERKAKGDWAGKRVELRTTEEYSNWLDRKGKMGGFAILLCMQNSLGKINSLKTKDGVTHTIQHQAVLYEGKLEVIDAENFRGTLEYGIGSAKGFGFGLLSIAP